MVRKIFWGLWYSRNVRCHNKECKQKGVTFLKRIRKGPAILHEYRCKNPKCEHYYGAQVNEWRDTGQTFVYVKGWIKPETESAGKNRKISA